MPFRLAARPASRTSPARWSLACRALLLALAALTSAGVQAADPVPVFRFYNTAYGTHFYTISPEERDAVRARHPQFAFEGTAFGALAAPAADALAVYRFFNTSTGTHFYTASEAEKDFVRATYPALAFEGPAYYVPREPGEGRVALHRFFNTRTSAHFFTTSTAERDHVLLTWPWFVYEGVAFQVYATARDPGTGSDVAPKVALAASSTSVAIPGSVTLTASVSDPDGAIASVSFLQDGVRLAEIAGGIHVFTVPLAAAGTFSFTAEVIDARGATTRSAPVAVTAAATPVNAAPRVSLSASSPILTVPGTLTLTATASDADGTILNVTFLQDGAPVAEITRAPFTFTVPIAAAGVYRFAARASDNGGASSTTPPISITGTHVAPVVTTDADLWRLLNQATFGASQAEAARVRSIGLPAWIEDQFAQPVSGYPDGVYNRIQLRQSVDCGQRDAAGTAYPAGAPQAICYRDHLTPAGMARAFFTNAVRQPDQLRQRVAWALAQIHVVSTAESDLAVAYPMARYQNILFEEAFGNFGNLLRRITLSPAMGNWLDMVNNDKPNAATGRVPNENFAREVLQLFSIGLTELRPDGTPLRDADGRPIPTYDQDDVRQFARAFTGWTYAGADGTVPTRKNPPWYAAPMVPYPNGHDVDAKALLNGTTLPPNRSIQQDLDAAVRNVFAHPNVGPFIGRQLIQKLVTGNPSPAYVERVARVFDDDGHGVRGDMKAVLRAILLDAEARPPAQSAPDFGSLREPVLMVTGLIRALSGVTDGFDLANRTAALGQRPYASPSVFNFFSPETTIAGTSIVAPEFGIHNSNSAIARANLVYALVYNGINPDPTVPGASGTRLNTQQFDALAADPGALVDQVNDVLLAGQLPRAARDVVVQAVAAVPASDRAARSRMAVYLIASSFHYQVQR